MSNLEALYLKLPIPLQHVICSLEGWRIQRSRYNREFYRFLAEAEARTFWSPEQIINYRNERLQHFVQHCAKTVPYYRRKFKEWRVDPRGIRTLEDLAAHVPILAKDEVRANTSEFISETIPKRSQIKSHTSGTTGAGLRFVTHWDSVYQQWAVWWRYRRWHGIRFNEWSAHLGGRLVVPLHQKRPPFWRYNRPGRQILFSGYHMNPKNLDAYVRELARSRVAWLHGYPSLLALLASHMLENNLHLPQQVRWVTVGGENLLPRQRQVIERAFGVKPRQHYGLAEAVANISECERGTLHVDEDFSAVEFVPNPDGAGYRLIGTNSTNWATPLLRYDTEDIVSLGETTCSCGRPGRVVQAIDGRKEDYVVLADGTRIGRMAHLVADLVHIKEAQIYQERPGEIIWRVVKGKEYTTEDEAMLIQNTIKRVGKNAKISVQYLDRLERSKNGKLRYVISDIEEGKLERV